MPAWVPEWLPLIAVAGLAGLFNLLVASEKFNHKFRSPFFKPWTSLGLWWWILIQLSLPTACFWLLFGSSLKLPITADLITKAITVGLGFTPFVNANIDLGFAGLPLGEFYFALTQLAYRQVSANQRGTLANFKSDLQQELSQNTSQLETALDYLKNYFEGDPSLRIEEERDFLKRIEATRTTTPS